MARIRAVHRARQLRRAERAALEAVYDLSSVKTGADYERFVANILTASNISTVRVGQSGDYGADLLANTATGTAFIQCKFYTHPVGYDAVKEAYTAKAIYHATAAYVVSNAAFTTQARRAASQLYELRRDCQTFISCRNCRVLAKSAAPALILDREKCYNIHVF